MARLIALADAQLEPQISGALYWRAESTLIVADLHFEKASSFARRGRHLPPYDTKTTIARLEELMEHYEPERVICLGDSFHDPDAASRMSEDDTLALGEMCGACDWIWVRGNHDPAPPAAVGGRGVESFTLAGIVFRHVMESGAAPEISGHFHPKASVPALGRNVTRPCFVYDAQRLVLPAFGAFTGGLNVSDAAFRPRFPEGFNVTVLGARKLHWFSSDDIAL